MTYEITEKQLERLGRVHMLLAREIMAQGPIGRHETHSLINSIIMVVARFEARRDQFGDVDRMQIDSDLHKLRNEAETLRKIIEGTI